MAEYIERVAAIEAVKSLYPAIPLVKLNIDKWHEKNKAYMECETAIERIPAADVRPVVRGFWVEENGEDAHTGELWCIWKCSECGARRTAGWRHTQEGRKPRDNFCPNCGARMEES